MFIGMLILKYPSRFAILWNISMGRLPVETVSQTRALPDFPVEISMGISLVLRKKF
jgi:hypothetical protein